MTAGTDRAPATVKSASARVIIVVGLVVAGALGLLAVSLFALRRGTATRADGEPAMARVERAGDGSCIVGGQREHCYRLDLTVLPKAGEKFRTTLDVNVPDRWASRVQPGAYIWVVRDREEPQTVLLALDAFEEPAPKPEPVTVPSQTEVR
ncbi:MAG: hypothetical protein QM784_25485 [Polyangiaceae bacterium]